MSKDEGEVGGIDGEVAWISRCTCGKEYDPWGVSFVLGDTQKMECCGKTIRWTYTATVYEVEA